MAPLATVIARTLAKHGVTDAFGVVGNGNMLIATGLIGAGVRYVPARHEGGAMAMADAYHRVTGQVAVCTATYGPGFTNLATGLAEAAKHRSGVLAVCGDGPVDGPRPIDIDQSAFAAPLGARIVRLTDPATAATACAEALEAARTGPCPVVVLVPSDLLEAAAPEEAAADLAQERTPVVPGPAETQAVRRALAGARRPLLLAGLGAWRSGAGRAIAELADGTGALLATTVMASGLFAGNPWSLGLCGGFASPRAAELIGEADVVVAFGASLGHWTLHGGRLLDPRATLVQVDVAEGPTSDRVDLHVRGDAAAVAALLLEDVRACGRAPSPWRPQVAGLIERSGWRHVPYDDAGTADRIDPRTLTLALADLLPAPRTVVTDGGHFVAWPAMYWPVPDPSGLVFTGAAFQTIGLGFAGAVGAAIARPDRTTVAVLGDGGALMGLSELETLIRVARSALVVVYDDAAYGAEVHMYGALGAKSGTAVFDDTDFAGVARSLGATAVTVRRPGDLAALRYWNDNGRRGTLVLDCKVVPHVVAKFLTDLYG
jgi:thiamine pyrophosphate-dependent acetolactate synthase large subunit-like protein